MTAYADLMAFQRETEALAQVAGRLGWDQETVMPRGAAAQRAEEMGAMESVLHARRVDPRVRDWLAAIDETTLDDATLDEAGRAQLRLIRRSHRRSTLVPARLAAELARVTSAAQGKWAEARAAETLTRVGLPQDRFPLSRYPHELSGGQRQRVVIAIAIALRPRLLIADEPTTALDVTTQAQILTLLTRLAREDGMGLLMITHDLAVVADMADRIIVMRKGQIVEQGETQSLLRDMRHPYTCLLYTSPSPRD